MSVSDLIDEFLGELGRHTVQSPAQTAILRRLLLRVAQLAEGDSDALGLAVAAAALDELLQASAVFAPYLERPKLTVFGSARTTDDNPLYEMARQLSEAMAGRGWMTISGAGPGIMEASAKGAGREHTLGVNIDLPFEQDSNPYIDADSKLIDMKYFFTRKVAMTRASRAFVIFPGGLGTMDEAFEVLTLLHTGMTNPAPVALVDTPQGDFWEQWTGFLRDAIIADGYVGGDALSLTRVCHSNDEVIEEIERFFANYVGFDVDGSRASLMLRHRPTPDQVAGLAARFQIFTDGEGFTMSDDTTLSFTFDGRQYVTLRLLIDHVNAWYWD